MNHPHGSLRIAQVCTFYHPATGGVAGVARTLSEELVRRGHEVTVFSSDRNIDGSRLFQSAYEETLEGVRIRRFRTFARRTAFGITVIFSAGTSRVRKLTTPCSVSVMTCDTAGRRRRPTVRSNVR